MVWSELPRRARYDARRVPASTLQRELSHRLESICPSSSFLPSTATSARPRSKRKFMREIRSPTQCPNEGSHSHSSKSRCAAAPDAVQENVARPSPPPPPKTSRAEATFEALSDEILLRILSNLEARDLARLTSVSQRFGRLAVDPHVSSGQRLGHDVLASAELTKPARFRGAAVEGNLPQRFRSSIQQAGICPTSSPDFVRPDSSACATPTFLEGDLRPRHPMPATKILQYR